MILNFFKIFCFIMAIKNFPGRTLGVRLGEKCLSNQECDTGFSKCHQESGICSCLPYYAPVNNTCLQSTLLGFECVVDEQCSLKVANSRCLNNVCECESKFWQYRRHTCLSPAKLGEVCYSDTHCALADKNNRCEFTMPGVFGFCICNSASQDCIYKGQDSILIKPNNSAFKYPFSKPDLKKKIPYQKRPWQTDDLRLTTTTSTIKPFRPVNKPQMPPLKRPIIKTNLTNNGIKFTAIPVTNTQSSLISLNNTTAALKNITFKPQFSIVPTPPPIKIYLKSPLKDSQNISQTIVNNSPIKLHKKPISNTGIMLRKGESKRRISLGFPCVSDAQCMRNDENSRCLQGICDCPPNNKTIDQCTAKTRGCLQNTFQCRSSGKCISWFFVCDGRTGDCGEDDNSDEECSGYQQCPSTTFACRSDKGPRNLCVSRSTRCDGVKNCPFGDDEEGCNAIEHKGCPAYTLQCGDGQCLPEYELCNAVVTCVDKSDELEGLCGGGGAPITVGNRTSAARPPQPLTRVRGAYRHSPAECPFRCRNGRCRSTAVLCSGRDGCGDGSDESGCSVCKCPAVS